VTPTGFVISRRGNDWEIIFENAKNMVSVSLSDTMFLKFTRESAERLEVAHGG
jgi:hypothetical protein